MMETALPTLIIGYGNVDRQDDGLAWHVLADLWARLGRQPQPDPDEGFDLSTGGPYPHFLFTLQLTPELAELISSYDRVLFVDAHTGRVPEEIHLSEVNSEYQTSPFTHHMTPATCVALSSTLFGKGPSASLVSIRGYEFGFSRNLSPATAALIPTAVDQILDWLDEGLSTRK